jgi:hypothetical protein
MAVYQHHHYYQPNLKTHQKQKSTSKSNEAQQRNKIQSKWFSLSFFVSFFPLDIVTRRSEQEPKQAASRV